MNARIELTQANDGVYVCEQFKKQARRERDAIVDDYSHQISRLEERLQGTCSLRARLASHHTDFVR
jgi:hypothetical protein